MDGNKHKFFKKRPSFQFKRKGENKRGKWNNSCHEQSKWNNSSREQSSGNSQPSDTVYRILCPSRKIGGVIGKGGSIVKALREESKAKITVADSVPGSDERVIIIYSSPTRISSTGEDLAEDNGQEPLQLHCAAQDALLRVHDRIVEEDLFGGMTFDDDSDNNVVTARLLVPNNMVGCLLGKRGDVIQRLRSDTGASIRVLPAEHLPSCAMGTDELVQISGKPNVTKKALYDVSTLLHQNPRKDKPLSNFPMPIGRQGFPPHGTPMPNMLPPGNSMWSHRNHSSHSMPPMPWMGEFRNQPPGFLPGGIDGGPGRGGEASAEFSMKILCSAEKIGGVIGKGGFNVKQLQQETGASIHVQDATTEADERVIRVSAFEALWNPRSHTIEAILQLQHKTSEFSEKGGITTRLLVPSSKVGCILGQGGHVINEMRRRTQADIRVYSKDDKPKCAAEDEELVQISGNFGVSKDALTEIASRLRVRTLRDSNTGAERTPLGPAQGFGPARGLPGGGHSLPSSVGFGSSSGYDPLKGRCEYEPPSYRVLPAAPGYPNLNIALEGKIPNNAVRPVIGAGGSSISNVGEIGESRLKLQDSRNGGSESIAEMHSTEHLHAAQSILEAFMASAGQNMNPHHGSYEYTNTRQGSYRSVNTQQSPYHQGSYHSVNTQQSPYQYQMNAQQSPYQLNAQQEPYANSNNAPQGAYHITTQQGAYDDY
ncbi:hypothetical protein FNV43_RR13582 [Rhamnella rubrinervis]|uniref:K Homology domain-containing protein n=1 Tax=Rhamnella rubrinervis TaxID=2594499 RepID=A0A8K0H1E2_9ROSA|nr:hypothetical protein FNV43_RR13582 [Rhamnella rubrinervis]